MASPFPGMDPYLESHWGDVHHRLITYACDRLQPLLPHDLRARVEEEVYVESPLGQGRILVPDVHVLEKLRSKEPTIRKAIGNAAVAEPLIVELDEPITQGFIEIRETGTGKRVLTVIEVLSPVNKTSGAGQNQYRQKQEELLAGGVSLVEIDLLRAGQRRLPCALERLPRNYRTPYQVCVRRGWQPTTVAIYRVPLRERLPVIAVPLRPADDDVPLDLQALVDLAYQNGSYEDDLDYQADPEPPLASPDARWANTLLRQRGLRPARRRRTTNGDSTHTD
jgi:hypothetical protein